MDPKRDFRLEEAAKMQNLHQLEKEDLKKILAQHGRGGDEDLMAVLDTFLATETHQSAQDLKRRLKARGLDYDLEAVQNALELFCHFGFAQAKSFNGQETLYEHRHLGQHHDHLICTRCGKVEEFVSPRIEELQIRAARGKGFIPMDHRLEIYGLCSDCAQERGPAVPLCDAEPGEHLLICGHVGGEDLQRRLTDMGLNNGAEVEVLSRNGGPVIVACRGSRLALGRGMSEKIMVSPKEDEPSAGPPCCKRRLKKKKRWGL